MIEREKGILENASATSVFVRNFRSLGFATLVQFRTVQIVISLLLLCDHIGRKEAEEQESTKRGTLDYWRLYSIYNSDDNSKYGVSNAHLPYPVPLLKKGRNEQLIS